MQIFACVDNRRKNSAQKKGERLKRDRGKCATRERRREAKEWGDIKKAIKEI